MGRSDDLIEAARGGNYPLVERILSVKPKKAGPFASLRRQQGGIGSRDASGYTALHYAALNGHKEVVSLLLSYEASCNSVDEAGSSPLHLAAWAGHSETVRILLVTGPSIPNVNLTNGDKETALHCAAQYGHLEGVKLLLDAGADPNIKNRREETCLDHAAHYGRTETVRILLDCHPEMVGKYTAYGSMIYTHTPLHLASRNGHTRVVEELLRVGLDINVRTARGTALHEAALCGKVDIIKTLLTRGINASLIDQHNRTVLDVCAELETQRTGDIARIILSFEAGQGPGQEPLSPYDNVSLLGSLEGGEGSPVRPRAPSWQSRDSRAARSVEDLDKRISSFSNTSGCSDCTVSGTSTLQGAKSYDSNFLSESELTMTGTLTRGGDDTSISSASSSASLSPVSCTARPDSSVSQNTLTGAKPPVAEKPKLPAKPAHIRPGLKPVRIPNVDDKLGLRPRKPPRRNLSISPVRSQTWDSETGEGDSSSTCSRKTKAPKTVYSSKSGSKSFDELDDLLSERPRKASTKRRGRRTQSSVSGADVMKAAERRQAAERRRAGAPECGHSCDEVLTASFHSAGHGESDSGSVVSSDCQRCVLNSISNRTLSRELNTSSDRFISQRQYKRKIRRESGREGSCSQPSGYSTLDPRTERRLSSGRSGGERVASTRLVSKTTYKLKRFEVGSDLDSAGEEKSEKSSMELMEVPLSPTHYSQPPTPDHSPPSPWEAESAIHSVLSFLRMEHTPRQRSMQTATEQWMLLPLEVAAWPSLTVATSDQATSTRPSPLPRGRALPEIPREEAPAPPPVTNGHSSNNGYETGALTPESEEDNRVVLRPKNLGEDSAIYQTIGGEESEGEERAEDRGSKGSEASQSLSILSPFDEQEEWSKISQIINSFGADIGKQTEEVGREGRGEGKDQCSTPHNSPVYEYPTLKRREKLSSSLQEWLRYISMEKYLEHFQNNGFDDLSYMGGGLMTREDLVDIGIDDPADTAVLLDSLRLREHKFSLSAEGEPERAKLLASTLEDWLAGLGLSAYLPNFKNNLVTDMERILDIWDEELASIVEVEKVGHRRRMLLSVAGPAQLRRRGEKRQLVPAPAPIPTPSPPIATPAPAAIPATAPAPAPAPGPTSSATCKAHTKAGLEEEVPEVKSGGKRHSATESELSLARVEERRYTSTSSASESSDRPPTPSRSRRAVGESGTLTLGRRKKKAPPPPSVTTSPQPKRREVSTTDPSSSQPAKVSPAKSTGNNGTSSSKKTEASGSSGTLGSGKEQSSKKPEGSGSSGTLTSKKGEAVASSGTLGSRKKCNKHSTGAVVASSVKVAEAHAVPPAKEATPAFSASFKVMYHGNALVKDFQGIETTRESIERVKTSKDIINRTGMPTTVYITEAEVKITIFGGQEPLHQHEIGNISCIVYDTDNMCMFGYITSDIDNLQRFSHVFSAESKDKASEILTAICRGYKEGISRTPQPNKDASQGGKGSTRSKSGGARSKAGKEQAEKKASSAATRDQRSSRGDQLVSRMKSFFQGGDGQRSYSASQGSRAAEARRKRGASMDNLLDPPGDQTTNLLTGDTKKKCSSIKNLSSIMGKEERREQKEVKITSV